MNMTINQQENLCPRCHNREKFFETFKKCFYCSKKYCQQCWTEFQTTEDYKLLNDILPKVNATQTRRICPTCVKTLLQQSLKSSSAQEGEDDYQLALAMSLSQSEAEEKSKQKRKLEEEEKKKMPKIDVIQPKTDENLLEQTSQAIQRFMNRAKSNYERNRDAIGDTALLSAFISLQACATELEQLKDHLHNQRQYFETLQEKLTALRDAREALNVLRHEHEQSKRREREHLEQHRRLLMMQKVADLRQFKHNQIANFQENYLQRLRQEEQEMIERLQKQKLLKEEQFGS